VNTSTAGRVVLITGGNRGIGLACARSFADLGDRVAVTYRAEPVEGFTSVQCDVSSSDDVDTAFREVEERLGKVEVLVANAGVTKDGLVLRMSDDDFTSVVDTNLTGSFLCAQRAIAMMKAQRPHGGRIINNGSISAHTPRPSSAPYTATKHAITGLTKSIALDGRPFGITCGQIDIGNAETSMTTRMVEGVLQADGTLRAEPRMDVRDVARAVSYMASLPSDANVLFMTVMAAGMPFVGRG